MEISDAKIWEISKLLYTSFQEDNQQQKLNVDYLQAFKQQNVKPLYPHKVDPDGKIQRYKCSQICKVLDPGSFFCCKTVVPDSSFRKLGLGMCLYFKFLKHATTVFTIVSLFSLISCLLCFLVSVQNQFNPFQAYSTFFFSSTLGTFSSEHFKCQYAVIASNQAHFAINCPYGNIQLYGLVFSDQSQNNLNNCRNEIDKYLKKSSMYSTSAYVTSSNQGSCGSGQKQCSIDVTFSSARPNFTTVSYGFQCLNQVYQLGNIKIKSQNLFYAVISFDLISCLALILFYWSQKEAEAQQVKYFKCEQINLSDFSLKIKGFSQHTFQEQFNLMIRQLTNELGSQFLEELVQVKMPDDQDYLKYQRQKYKIYNKLYELIDFQFFQKEKNPYKFQIAQEFQCLNFNFKSYKKYKQQLSNLINKYIQLEYNPNLQKSDKSLSIFIVVNTIKMKKQIYQHQQNGCLSKYYQFDNRQYRLSQAPAPDTILWQNKGKNTYIRVLVSWILSLGICFASYMLFGFIQYQQNLLLNSYSFNINCGILYSKDSLITFDEVLNQQSSNYLTCFCEANLFNFNNACSNWNVQYAIYLAIPVIISVLLVIYNVLVSSIFKWLTFYQCHQLVTKQLLSYTIKRSFLLVMNLGLVMILINQQYSNSYIDAKGLSYLFQGTYIQFTAAWYINIGSIIILTLLFNIMFPVIQLTLANILKCLKRCWDKKLCFIKTSCKTKSDYIRLFSNDVYPIEQRYAFLISVIIITMAFSCIIPILNLICCISLFLLYLTDKALIFKVYQTPINYNDELHYLITKTIYLGVVFHMLLSAYFLSDWTLLSSNSSAAANSNHFFESSNETINLIFNAYYIIPYIIISILLIGRGIFNHTLVAFCNKCTNVCKKNLSNINQYKLGQNFYQSLSLYQIKRLKQLTEAEIIKIAQKKNRFYYVSQNLQGNPLNQTFRPLSETNKMDEREALLKRTLKRIEFEESQKSRQTNFSQIYLIGMPAYEHTANQQFFEQNKKNIRLSQALNNCLKEQIYDIGNQNL